MAIREIEADRDAFPSRDGQRLSEWQSEQKLQLAGCPRGAESGEGLASERGIVRGHRGVPSAPRNPIDEGQETQPRVDLWRSGIGPLPLHDPDIEVQVDRSIRILQAPSPPARERTSDPGIPRHELGDQEKRGIRGLGPQGIEMNDDIVPARPSEDLAEEVPREPEWWRFHGDDAVDVLLADGLDRGQDAACNLSGVLAVVVPEANRAANSALGEGATRAQSVGKLGPYDVRAPGSLGQCAREGPDDPLTAVSGRSPEPPRA
jgi:hypothetical protein